MASLEDIKTIGVIGAGQMGNGIAHVIALAGYDVRILDISQDALDKALGLMDKNMDRQVKKRTDYRSAKRFRTCAGLNRNGIQLPFGLRSGD